MGRKGSLRLVMGHRSSDHVDRTGQQAEELQVA